ncbi:MAG: glycosyltransferase [Bythopirellula sp.]|nr:glycosyltransferase [Bythopirellula sp.]
MTQATFLITALGSYGDVHPMVGLGAALQARGHRAAIISNPHFQSLIESMGLEFLPLGTAEQYHELAHHPDLWNPMKGPLLIMRLMAQSLRELYDIIDANVIAGETVLGAHCLDFASRIHHDKHGTPLASIFFAPMGLRSFHQSPQMFRMLMQPWLPKWFRRFQFWLADKFVDYLVARQINALRQDLGLSAVKRVLHEWYFSPQMVLGLFPSWFGPPQPDWPLNTHVTGFPLWDEAASAKLSPQLSEFLKAGSPPLVFAPGSANTDAAWFFNAAAEACQKLGRRGILLSRYSAHIPQSLPPSVIHCEFVPFSQLLPRAAALVHHGGIGTCAQGLAAGVPQIVMPMAYDQLDNASRLKRLGVADSLSPKNFTGTNLTHVLGKLLATPSVQERAQHWSAEVKSQDALTETCVELEKLTP